jgi:hypothetical protein
MQSHSEFAGKLVARFPRLFKGEEPQLGICVGDAAAVD